MIKAPNGRFFLVANLDFSSGGLIDKLHPKLIPTSGIRAQVDRGRLQSGTIIFFEQ